MKFIVAWVRAWLDRWREPLELRHLSTEEPNWSHYGLYRRGRFIARVAVEYLPFKVRVHVVRVKWVWVRRKSLEVFLRWLEGRVREVANVNKVEIFQSEKDYRDYGKQ